LKLKGASTWEVGYDCCFRAFEKERAAMAFWRLKIAHRPLHGFLGESIERPSRFVLALTTCAGSQDFSFPAASDPNAHGRGGVNLKNCEPESVR